MRKLIIFFVAVILFFTWFSNYFSSGKFQQFLNDHPHPIWSVRIQYGLSTFYYMRREYEKAIESDNYIVEIYPKSPFAEKALLHRARSYSSMGNKQEAIKTYELFMKTYPESERFKDVKKKHKRLRTF